jgi:hypothetical protein
MGDKKFIADPPEFRTLGDNMYKETKKRTFVKAVAWRLIAIVNSFTILALGIADGNLENALLMNASGIIVYFLFERAANQVEWGKEEL